MGLFKSYSEKELKRIEPLIKKINDFTWWIDPDISVNDMYRNVCGSEFKGETDSNTMGGWILEKLQKLPVKGDWFVFGNLEITVSEMEDKRIKGIIVKKKTID